MRGRLGPLEDKGYSTLYNVKLYDGHAAVLLNIPRHVLPATPVKEGDYVSVVGSIKTEVNEYTRQQLQFRVAVSEIRPTASPEELEQERQERATIARMNALGSETRPFPAAERIEVAVICSRNSKVLPDFQSALKGMENIAVITTVPANLRDRSSVAEAIGKTRADVLVVIRGGGDPEEFEVFNSLCVLAALAAHPAYRVTGLGHTGNHTLADLFADFAANVPARSGQHIREQIELRAAARAAATIQPRLKEAKRMTARLTVTALLVGIILGLLARFLLGRFL